MGTWKHIWPAAPSITVNRGSGKGFKSPVAVVPAEDHAHGGIGRGQNPPCFTLAMFSQTYLYYTRKGPASPAAGPFFTFIKPKTLIWSTFRPGKLQGEYRTPPQFAADRQFAPIPMH